MKLNILLEGDPILRVPCVDVPEVTPGLRKLAIDMCETMVKSRGLGLAAPQIGQSIKLIVFDTSNDENNGDSYIMFNPQILHGEGSVFFKEGCLSLPGVIVRTDRFRKVKVKYLNMDNMYKIVELNRLAAVVFQHEFDHLSGILLSDKL